MKIDMGNKTWILLICLFLVDLSHAAGIYKWTDAEGDVHYGEQAPPEGAQEMHLHSSSGTNQDDNSALPKKNIDPKIKRDKMIQAMQGDRLERQEKKQQQRQKQAKQRRQCALDKDILRRFMRAASLYNLDADGNRQKLPDAVKQKKIRHLQAEIKKRCK